MPDAMTPAVPRARRGGKLEVVIVGGGVAAVEAALCLHDLAGDLVSTTIIAPNDEFAYLPMAVQEPFGHPLAKRYPLALIAEDAGAEVCSDSFTWLDNEFRVAHTKGGEQLHYDALMLAPGARVYANFRYSITLDPHRLDEQLHGVLQDIEGGHVHTLGFVIPDGAVWPLPIYELALMTAARARDLSVEVAITIVTPEPAPLAIFGEAVADHVAQLLEHSGIVTILSTRSAVHGPGLIAMHPGNREIGADRVIVLPQLFGPSCGGVPTSSPRGFISTDAHGRIHGIDRAYAAGDATDFRIKFGAIAAQQADIAAQSIAALAGAAVTPDPFRPELRAVLLTGDRPLLLSAEVGRETATHSHVTDVPTLNPPAKIAAKYLTPYLRELDSAAHALTSSK